ncbi:hypothetical protein [Corynebacterium pacaense]|uniref:hypothetical protein n=1 Tax=Corynebacterium pacaense TaxID=1816684 RepID=UPI0009BBAF0F|nr:hypothetical protein [Corynebacterium pacaense]
MRYKKTAAAILTVAMITGSTTATANAVTAPYPSSEIQMPREFVQTVQNFGVPHDLALAGLQVVAAWLAIGVGSSVASVGSSVLGLGLGSSTALSTSLY